VQVGESCNLIEVREVESAGDGGSGVNVGAVAAGVIVSLVGVVVIVIFVYKKWKNRREDYRRDEPLRGHELIPR
jgi:hypothetical protein